MVTRKTTKHTHPRRVRYPARLSATIGYVLLVIAWFMAIGTAGVVILDFIALQLPLTITNSTGLLESIGGSVSYSTESPDATLAGKVLLGTMLVVVAVLSSHFVAVHASRLLHYFLQAIGLKLTQAHLFVSKCLLALFAPLAMMVATLGFPAGFSMLGVIAVAICGAIAGVSVVSFSVQHVIARRHSMAAKSIL